MPKQALWDIYESALMLDTYFRIECGEISLKAAILDLSAKLRRKAIRNGDIIDDVCRNPNGISPHLEHMKYALTNGKEGLSHGLKFTVKLCEFIDKNLKNMRRFCRKPKVW